MNVRTESISILGRAIESTPDLHGKPVGCSRQTNSAVSSLIERYPSKNASVILRGSPAGSLELRCQALTENPAKRKTSTMGTKLYRTSFRTNNSGGGDKL